jgi:hypothetical protein
VSRYREEEVFAFLNDQTFEFDGDQDALGMGWFSPNGHAFTLPWPVGGYFNADLIDRILSDRWIWTGSTIFTRYPD